jgi:spore coat-associated protein N
MGIKKRLAGAALAAGIGVAAISGGTFALFTSSATNDANTFAAGTLTIEDITGGNGSAAFTVTNMAPGDSGNGTVKIKNSGSLDAWVAIDTANDTGDLAPALNITADTTAVLIPAGEEADFTVNYDLPLATGNEYQGKSAQLDVVFKAVQAKNNTTNGAPISWN